MDSTFDALVLYYTAFREFEITLKEMKEMLVSEIGEEGLKQALEVFKQKRLEREAAGDKRTLYEATKK
jgi:hypothetical protein